MFKGLKHMFKALKLLSTALGQVFQGLKQKIPLGGRKNLPRKKKIFPTNQEKTAPTRVYLAGAALFVAILLPPLERGGVGSPYYSNSSSSQSEKRPRRAPHSVALPFFVSKSEPAKMRAGCILTTCMVGIIYIFFIVVIFTTPPLPSQGRE